MTEHRSSTRRVWGSQYPFERNHLQRMITLSGLGSLFAVALVVLVLDDVRAVLGVALVCAGLVAGLGALSRWSYVRETEIGFAILFTRDGRFVLWSAAACLAVGVLTVVMILR